MVAIKEPIFRGKGQDGSIGEDDDEIFMKEALCIFREFRQEVTVLSQLEHPNIVALLGVSIRPLCMAIEYAPMGSLFDILEMEMEKLKQEQADVIQVSPVLRMPGGVLGHVMTTKVALQVCESGFRYGEEVEVWGRGAGVGKYKSQVLQHYYYYYFHPLLLVKYTNLAQLLHYQTNWIWRGLPKHFLPLGSG